MTETARQTAGEARQKLDAILSESISIERRLSGSSVLSTLSLEEIASLQSRKAALDIQMPVAQRELEKANRAFETAKRSEEDRTREIELYRIHLRNADSERRFYAERLEQARRDLETATQAVSRAERELSEHDLRIAGVKTRLEALEEKRC